MEIHKITFDAWRRSYIADAEIFSVTRPRKIGVFIHTQDFFEVMYIISGQAKHFINGSTKDIQEGDLLVVRPGDYHDIGVSQGDELYFHNMYIHDAIWREYCNIVEIDPMIPGKDPAQLAHTSIPEADRPACRSMFDSNVSLFHEHPTKLIVYRFMGNVLGYIRQIQVEPALNHGIGPAWLMQACRAMHDWENLAEGLPKFIELSGVSLHYLSRVLKAATGQTATEYITALRLKRSSALLANTRLTIAEIALDSGFENLPYFYRRFQQHFGKTPRQYRMTCQQPVNAETI